MDKGATVSACDEDVAMRAVGEVFAKIQLHIICTVKQEQPLLMLTGQPSKGILFRFTYSLGESNVSKVCSDSVGIAGIHKEDL
jgi:hypothetical protein